LERDELRSEKSNSFRTREAARIEIITECIIERIRKTICFTAIESKEAISEIG
jgi:hypothetical protein